MSGQMNIISLDQIAKRSRQQVEAHELKRLEAGAALPALPALPG